MWIDLNSGKVFNKIIVPEAIKFSIVVRASPVLIKDYIIIFVLSDFKRLYAMSPSGQVLCDFSDYLSQHSLEIYGSGKVIYPLSDSLFVANVDINCFGCPRPDSNIALFYFDIPTCSIQFKKFLFPEPDFSFDKLPVSPSPEFTNHDSILLVTVPFIDSVYIIGLPDGNNIQAIHIKSLFYQKPTNFSFSSGFKTYAQYRKAIRLYRQRNSWVKTPIALKSDLIGTFIYPKVPDDLPEIQNRPITLWIKKDSSHYDIVFKTSMPVSKFIGGYSGSLYLSSINENGKQTVYKFQLEPNYLKCVQTQEAFETLWNPYRKLYFEVERETHEFIQSLLDTATLSAILWLPTGCQSDITLLPENPQAYQQIIVLTMSENLKNLLPDGINAISPPHKISQHLNSQFPTLTLFVVENGKIRDTLLETQVPKFFSRRTN
ncbi:MAG: hypothetical protein GXO48_04470 [Chlorobi bacterium]|nr:hypothetical protein [Chlorobiota bacterium]